MADYRSDVREEALETIIAAVAGAIYSGILTGEARARHNPQPTYLTLPVTSEGGPDA